MNNDGRGMSTDTAVFLVQCAFIVLCVMFFLITRISTAILLIPIVMFVYLVWCLISLLRRTVFNKRKGG